jgi:methionyl-tRNA formyltransferase
VRLAFLGSAEMSLPTLRACAAEQDVVTIVTAPDRPGNRGAAALRTVADAGRELGIPVLQPLRLRRDATTELLALGLDALVVCAYGQILPERLLDGVRFGGVNVHPSLLPRWRGASPVHAAILAGDEETGVCIMKMDAGLDTGPVYLRESVPIPADATTPALGHDLAERGARMTLEVLAKLAAGTAVAAPQGADGVTYAPLLRRQDGRIDWAALSAAAVDRHVRAMQPWPGTTAVVGGADVRILRGEPEPAVEADEPGRVLAVEPSALLVAAAEGAYRILDVQPPGRRRMDAASYWRGRRMPA